MITIEAPVENWTRLIRAEYLEMPGLILTCQQIRRMWGMDDSICSAAIQELVGSGFLVRRPDGSYGRPNDLRCVRAS